MEDLEQKLKHREELVRTFLFDHDFYRETIFARIKEEPEYKPFINVSFVILTEENAIKIANKTIDILTFGIANIHGEFIKYCFTNNYRLVGIGSKKYGLEYFERHLNDNEIDYHFEEGEDGKIKLFI